MTTHHELGQDARSYDCMDAGGRATQEQLPRTMQELLSSHEEHEGFDGLNKEPKTTTTKDLRARRAATERTK